MSDYGFQPPSTTAGGEQPTIRIRNQHSHTLKDGWRLSETTVEMTFSLHTMEIHEAVGIFIESAQRHAFVAGQDEAVRRNQVGHMEPVQ